MFTDGKRRDTTIWNDSRLFTAYLCLIAIVALAGLAGFYATAYFFPLQVFNAGIHELGHSIAVALTGGTVDSINIMMTNNARAPGGGITNHHGGNYMLVAPAGVLFSIIVAICMAKAPVIRWYTPVLCMGNLVQLSPGRATDGGGIFSVYGAYGIILYATVLMASLALTFCAIHFFVDGNIVSKLIKERTGLVSQLKEEIINEKSFLD